MAFDQEDLHVSRERIQRHIKIIHLDCDTPYYRHSEDIRAGVYELVAAREGEFDSDTEAFDSHDRYRADEGTYGDVDERVGPTVAWGHAVDHDEGENEDREAVRHEAWVNSQTRCQ